MDEYKFQIIPKNKTFYNADSSFGIYKFTTSDDIPNCEIINDNVTGGKLKKSSLIGTMPKLTLGYPYDVVAELDYNKQYSQYQYKVKQIMSAEMDSEESQKRFLMCVTTQTRADALLKIYPNIVKIMIDNMDENIDLSKVKGIGKTTYNTIKKQVVDHYEIRDIMSILSNVNVSMRTIEKMIDEFKSPAILKQNLITNPYILTKVHGLGFKSVDDIAQKLNPQMVNSKFRMEAFVTHFLKDDIAQKGHTWCDLDAIKNGATKAVPECIEHLDSVLNNASLIYISDDGKIGLKEYYNVEKKIFTLLKSYAQAPVLKTYSKDEVGEVVERVEQEEGFEYTEEQKNTIFNVLNNNISIISGEAGSGKSTVLKTILTVLKEDNSSITCCATSAKAAQRIIEATGFKATTIHVALEAKGLDNFGRSEDCPLEANVVCLDESSMVNASLFLKLICAIEKGSKIILTGDVGQLVGIGYGNVFSDLIENKDIFTTFELTEVKRQGLSSATLEHAREIRKHLNPLSERGLKLKTEKREGLSKEEYYNKWFTFGDNKDLHYKLYKCEDENDRVKLRNDAIESFMRLVKKDGGGRDAIEETAIITPRRQKCVNSSDEINKLIVQRLVQEKYINPKLGKVLHNFNTYYVGCKIMQTENNYEKQIYNGSIGFITQIKKERIDGEESTYVYAEFRDFETNGIREIVYSFKELEQISLAYALSTFKSQGSGFKNIIIVITYEAFSLLYREMIYTSMTRVGKGVCVMHIDPRAFSKAIKTKAADRNTFLKYMK